MNSNQIEIRDLRRKQFFMVDDEYLNGYARLCGISATGVYLSLCRHASRDQTCFPSKKLIAEELDISERTVYSALKKLEEWNIVKVTDQSRKKDGSYNNKIYTLLDKSVWKPKPTVKGNSYRRQPLPSANNDTHRRQPLPNKETNKKGTHINIENKDKLKAKDFVDNFKPTSYEESKLVEWARFLGEESFPYLVGKHKQGYFWALEDSMGIMKETDLNGVSDRGKYFNRIVESKISNKHS